MADPLHLFAVGSLAQAMADPKPVAGRPVVTRFGASGLLREAIKSGAPWEVFASLDPVFLRHP